MKRLLLGLLCIAMSFSFADVVIINYEPSQKDAVMEIFFQDVKQLFIGSAVIDMGLMTPEQFNIEVKKIVEMSLADANKKKWVLIDSDKVAGWIEFFAEKEQSLESVIARVREQYNTMTQDQQAQFASTLSYLKKTDAECCMIGKIESIAVSRDFRRRGHARKLLQKAIECIKRAWPAVQRVMLDVNAFNEHARKLYESEGFVPSAVQPPNLVMMQGIQYEKAI